MEIIENKGEHKEMLNMFRYTFKDDMNYVYRGIFTPNITDGIIALAEKNLDSGEDAQLKKRLYFIIVESLQNITRYQAEMHEMSDRSGIFVIQKKEKYYLITTGNLIDNNKIDYVRSKLETLNNMTEEELREYYKVVLRNGTFTDKGGAGLGMIEMARKSGNKLYYDFKKFDENCSFFYFHTILPTISQKEKQEIEEKYGGYLNHIMDLHFELAKSNISIVFNSGFSQDSLMSLIGLIETHIRKTGSLKRKFFNIMVEMLQNIIHHGCSDSELNEKGKPGIFYIIEREKEYLLNAGNYLPTKLVEDFHEKLDNINNLQTSELDELYSKKLFEFSSESYKKSGLGMLDMRIKSDSKLIFQFQQLNDKLTFYSLQIALEKQKDKVLEEY